MRFPELDDPLAALESGRVLVDGRPVWNPASQVQPGASLVVRPARAPRGAAKLEAALERFRAPVSGRIALDLGASTGGFTSVLLAHGAARVYAVDAGHGQLLGSLRQDPRVVNLEATNLARVDRRLVPDLVEVVTVDLSFIALARALPQLDPELLAPGADLLALVKPMFELGLGAPPTSEEQLEEAVRRAAAGAAQAGWHGVESARSPVLGAGGAVEFLLHARRR